MIGSLKKAMLILCVFTILGCADKADREKARAGEPGTEQTIIKSAPEKTADLTKDVEVKEDKTVQKETASVRGSAFLDTLNASLSDVAEAVKPSVVNISTTKTISSKEHPFGNFLDDPFFRRFFGDRLHPHGEKRQYKSSALGSGVIVTGDGYILTNNHVVQDVDEIKVVLHDKRELPGKIIGTDPKSDLAIIKVEAKDLPAITMGSSEKMKVGELVIAIGNPFSLGHTITMGIVSAVGRSNVGIAEYEDFIQTDAAINPGNSGGALVNIYGELIGINTAIFSTSGGYMGIGFAIPSDMVKTIMQSIIKHGKVVRGWLGVQIQNITDDLAKHFNIKEDRGALVTNILADTPAEKAGFQRGDVIVEYEGETVIDTTDLRNKVAATLPKTEVKIKVIREGKDKVITAMIGEQESDTKSLEGKFENVLSGVHVQELTSDLKKSLEIPEKASGVIVTSIEENSPASTLLKNRDVIQEINRKSIKDLDAYKDVVAKIGSKDNVLLLVYRSGGYIYITLNP
ncbi:MAG: DegQ family serine endoprotease [Nitrospiraceae bacterium]|nr:MAG: DegQ family serine endoprotease [Nitrospiraceae bacterium]